MSEISRSQGPDERRQQEHISPSLLSGLDQTPLEHSIPQSPSTEAFFSSAKPQQKQKQRYLGSVEQDQPSSFLAGMQGHPAILHVPSGTTTAMTINPSQTVSSAHNLLAEEYSGPPAHVLQPNSTSTPPPSSAHWFSPSVGYLSDPSNNNNGISAHTTPSFDDDFGDVDFGFINDLGGDEQQQLTSTALRTDQAGRPHPGVDPNQVHKSAPTNKTTSTSSYLLSPVDTATPSPLLETTAIGDQKEPPSLVQQFQRTPATTTRSSRSSEASKSLDEAAPMDTGAQLTSPIVRVEHCSAEEGQGGEHGSGRGRREPRSSSHLAPNSHQDDESSGDEDSLGGETSRPARAEDGSWLPSVGGQAGLDPTSRSYLGDDTVPSLKEQTENRRLEEKNVDVQNWIVGSAASSVVGDDIPPLDPNEEQNSTLDSKSRLRTRAKSTGDMGLLGQEGLGIDTAEAQVLPGPGLQIDEPSDSEEVESSEAESSPPASLHEEPEEIDPEEQSSRAAQGTGDRPPSPRRFFHAKPWADPQWPEGAGGNSKSQPGTSNAAIMRFRQRADNIETASRAATWGTHRRLSEADIEKVLDPEGPFKRLSFGTSKDKSKTRMEKRGGNLADMGKKLIPKRSGSNLKRNRSVKGSIDAIPEAPEKTRKESMGSRSIGRSLSFTKRPRSPKLDTSSAMAAIAGPLAAVGGSGSVNTEGQNTQLSLSRSRSRSELLRQTSGSSANYPGLSDLLARSGGPPMPTLASPRQGDSPSSSAKHLPVEAPTTEPIPTPPQQNEKGLVMDLKIRTTPTIPDYRGFQAHVKQLNPRLPTFLIDRVSQEQVRRYKKLVDAKVKHLHVVNKRTCNSKDYCFALGGQAKILPPRSSNSREDKSSTPALQGGSDDEGLDTSEGTVTAAQFPDGVPLPPVNRLPAEFECPLCFQVKKFTKPSDWTKHVHEDVQPFTCTFPNCAEPKSFKRKADWVRHENERHRQLEWWTCSLQDCSHTCYRKDNFVQHLVREHKMPEPKIKTTRNAKAGWIGGQPDPTQAEIDQLWGLVEVCRHDTPKQPRQEPCKFCGNVCSTWKKLTVHLARHMEQISLPVLKLVEQRMVTLDTIISPVESRQRAQSTISPQTATSSGHTGGMGTPLGGASPYSNFNYLPQQTPPSSNMGYATYSPSNAYYTSGNQMGRNVGSYVPQNAPSQQQFIDERLAAGYDSGFGPAGSYMDSSYVSTAQQQQQQLDPSTMGHSGSYQIYGNDFTQQYPSGPLAVTSTYDQPSHAATGPINNTTPYQFANSNDASTGFAQVQNYGYGQQQHTNRSPSQYQ